MVSSEIELQVKIDDFFKFFLHFNESQTIAIWKTFVMKCKGIIPQCNEVISGHCGLIIEAVS